MSGNLNNAEPSTYLMFRTEGTSYLISVTEVREVVDGLNVFSFPVECKGHLGVANCRGDIIDIVSLAEGISVRRSSLRHNLSQQRFNKTLIISFAEKGTIGVPCETIRKVDLAQRPAAVHELVNCDGEPASYITLDWLYTNLGAA